MLRLNEDMMLFRPLMETPERQKLPERYRRLRHPFFAWTGLRPIFAQHTREEHETLQRWARGQKTVVEIGVAEGGSALALRQAMPANGALYFIDPYHLTKPHPVVECPSARCACLRHGEQQRTCCLDGTI
jgi:hypothetical protein